MLQCPRYKKSSSCGMHNPITLYYTSEKPLTNPGKARLLCSCGERDTVPCSSGDPATETLMPH